MSETKKAPVQSTRGRKATHHFLFDSMLTYSKKVQKLLTLTLVQMQEMAAQHSGHAVALKLELGLSRACYESMYKLIPNSEHHIEDFHQKAAQYVQDSRDQPPLLPIDPHVLYVDTETPTGVIVQAKGDEHLQLDNATFTPGELNFEDGTRFVSKRRSDMQKHMCKIAVYWGVLGFNVSAICLQTRKGVKEMRPELPRPSTESEGTRHMADIFRIAFDNKYFRSKFEVPEENTTPSSDLTQFRHKLGQRLGVRFPAKASEEKRDDGAASARAERGEPERSYYFLGMPEQGSWISDEERYNDMQQSRDSGGSAASAACYISHKTLEQEDEEKTIKFIWENGARMEDEEDSWYKECLGYRADEDDKGSCGGDSSVQAAASATDWILDGESLVEGLEFPPLTGTPEVKAQTPEGDSAVEVPTASDAKSTGNDTPLSLKTGTKNATHPGKTKRKGVDAEGANPGVPTEDGRKKKAAKTTKRQRKESTLPSSSPAKEKDTASTNMHAGASQCGSDDSWHAAEPSLNSGVGAKVPSSVTKKKDSRIERLLLGGFV